MSQQTCLCTLHFFSFLFFFLAVSKSKSCQSLEVRSCQKIISSRCSRTPHVNVWVHVCVATSGNPIKSKSGGRGGGHTHRHTHPHMPGAYTHKHTPLLLITGSVQFIYLIKISSNKTRHLTKWHYSNTMLLRCVYRSCGGLPAVDLLTRWASSRSGQVM